MTGWRLDAFRALLVHVSGSCNISDLVSISVWPVLDSKLECEDVMSHMRMQGSVLSAPEEMDVPKLTGGRMMNHFSCILDAPGYYQ